MSLPKDAETQRLFFALYPDAVVRARLESLCKTLPLGLGRWVAPEKIHLTLVFLGDTSTSARDCVAEAASRVELAPFSLSVDHLGSWRGPGILWAGCLRPPAGLTALVDLLAAGARDCGLPLDPRPYHPHVTLARKVRRRVAESEIEPIPWEVSGFCLIASRPAPGGMCYEIVRSWSLGGC